ncbi:predicted protein [Chaetomium globosum CBS 148.51]|uniref:Uncharacterized protein n=1 Tax=Chaetomium globosum (strain ATCC 6205 / CBS 148.51 / DSM 1962 / NBRC 6347 / NRRL 1970) TaxID=306901 RepID=Q2H6A3_CHAGB|nr:uncharacterized protein CHGG_05812 [Chaetomium globosum CBS 148.51]EAQ89193.1 predicted protein [Chaetomium globosum CBS 148.51]
MVSEDDARRDCGAAERGFPRWMKGSTKIRNEAGSLCLDSRQPSLVLGRCHVPFRTFVLRSGRTLFDISIRGKERGGRKEKKECGRSENEEKNWLARKYQVARIGGRESKEPPALDLRGWASGSGRADGNPKTQRCRDAERQREAEPKRDRGRTTSAEGVQLSRPKNGRNWGTASLGGQNNMQARPAESHFKPPARCSTSMGCLGRGSHWSATNLPPPGFVQGRGQRSTNDNTFSDTPLPGADSRRLTPL